MPPPPRVLLSVPNGGSAGSVLRSGVLDHFLEVSPTAEVVLLSPLVRDAAFVREFARPRVVFHELPAHTPSPLEERLLGLMQAAYIGSKPTESVVIRGREAQADGMRWLGTKQLIARTILPSLSRKETRYALSDRFVSHPVIEAIFDRYRPDLYVASNPGFIVPEIPVMRTAVRRRVRSMAVDPSWDNFTNKLLPARRVDRLLVWNELMKRQAIDIHGYTADQIRITGAPQWDLYFRGPARASRDAFFRRIGADPSRRLVTLTTTPQRIYTYHDRVLRALIDAMRSNAWRAPAQLLVRLHPRDELDKYASFQGTPDVIIEKPFRSTRRTPDGLDVDMSEESRRHLADTLSHSDIVINVASTISIEAAIYDTPIVNVAFDGEAPLDLIRSARRYYRFAHYANIIRQGAVKLAETPSQMIEQVGLYLADPALDREGRRRVVAEQCQFTDGRAAERIATCVAAELAEICGLAPLGEYAVMSYE